MIETVIEKEHDLTVFKCSGTLTGSEILDTMKSFYEGSPTNNILWDTSESILKDTSVENVGQVLSISQKFESSRHRGKTAIVAPRNYTYGMSRMLQINADTKKLQVRIRAFRTIEEAREWLLS